MWVYSVNVVRFVYLHMTFSSSETHNFPRMFRVVNSEHSRIDRNFCTTTPDVVVNRKIVASFYSQHVRSTVNSFIRRQKSDVAF